MIQFLSPITRRARSLSRASEILPYWGTPDPYYGRARYTRTLAAYILSEFQYPALPLTSTQPSLRLDFFIAHAIAHSHAPLAAGAAAVVLMRMAEWQPLPACARSGQDFFLAALRFVLERYCHWHMPDDAWVAYGMRFASQDQVRSMALEMQDLEGVLTMEEKQLLKSIAQAQWSDGISFARGADGRLIVVVGDDGAKALDTKYGLSRKTVATAESVPFFLYL
ncbi:hypothetical protein HGRIS_014540 [Hohenbuehelia grisea]|uniref:Uncharacterized protein n=1 Tax=Hohenbuehelia grisea TaxID=104357 RepID=A0ABR3JTR2_9AGAR